MSGQPTIIQRVRLRRSLLQLASLLALTLITIVLVSLFCVWSLDRAYVRAMDENRQLVAALDGSRRVQMTFKLQVQEWKNLLLRGADPADHAKYAQAFATEAESVRASIEELSSRLATIKLERLSQAVSGLGREHLALVGRYQQALAAHTGIAWDGFAIDRAVRGIDRPLSDGIDRVAQQLLAEYLGRADRLARDAHDRYVTLRRMQWAAALVALGLVALLMWRVLRDRSLSD